MDFDTSDQDPYTEEEEVLVNVDETSARIKFDFQVQPTPFPSSCPFSLSAPDHAYPTKYPPQNVDDPFPTQNGRFTFPPPSWECVQTSDRRDTPPTLIDIDELSLMFASKLHMRESAPKKKNERDRPETKQWFSATVVRPYPAPLPALVRNGPPMAYSPSVVGLSSPTFQSIHVGTAVPKARKIPPLPMRLPTWKSPSHGTSNLESCYETDSYWGTNSPRSRLSSASSLSSMPVTPPLSPTNPNDPHILDLFELDSRHFLSGLYLQTIESESSKESAFFPLSPSSSFLNFPFSYGQ